MKNKSKLYVHFPDVFKNEVKNIEISFVKCFNSGYKEKSQLPTLARNLLDYLLEVMERDNVVRSLKIDRNNFNQFSKEITSIEYSDISIKKAFGELSKRRLLLKGNTRGFFYVNPLFFSKQDESHRKQMILDLTKQGILKQF